MKNLLFEGLQVYTKLYHSHADCGTLSTGLSPHHPVHCEKQEFTWKAMSHLYVCTVREIKLDQKLLLLLHCPQ